MLCMCVCVYVCITYTYTCTHMHTTHAYTQVHMRLYRYVWLDNPPCLLVYENLQEQYYLSICKLVYQADNLRLVHVML